MKTFLIALLLSLSAGASEIIECRRDHSNGFVNAYQSSHFPVSFSFNRGEVSYRDIFDIKYDENSGAGSLSTKRVRFICPLKQGVSDITKCFDRSKIQGSVTHNSISGQSVVNLSGMRTLIDPNFATGRKIYNLVSPGSPSVSYIEERFVSSSRSYICKPASSVSNTEGAVEKPSNAIGVGNGTLEAGAISLE